MKRKKLAEVAQQSAAETPSGANSAGGGAIPTPPLQDAHTEARRRFNLHPEKCYQRHTREVWGEIENRPQIESLKGATVRQITRKEAEGIILRYEWLVGDPKNKAPMGYGIRAYYGLFLNSELIGANCLGAVGARNGNICGDFLRDRVVTIARGACVPHAPKNAASFFIRQTCRQANADFGWEIFFAYSDHQAGEIGTVYQATNWLYFGKGLGRGDGKGKGHHYNYESPDGKRWLKSYTLNHKQGKKILKSMGWNDTRDENGKFLYPMRLFLRNNGWKEHKEADKGKWVWFEGTQSRKKELLKLAKEQRKYEPQPYPKRRLERP